MFFKIVVLRKIVVQNSCSQESCPRKAPLSEGFLIELQALRAATLIKRDYWEICQIFKNILFYWTSPVTDSFRFPVCNLKKEIPAKIFFCGFYKNFKNIFWQNTSRWRLHKFIYEFYVFQNIFHRASLRNCLFPEAATRGVLWK